MAVPTVTDVTAPSVAAFGVPFTATVDAVSGLPTVAVPFQAVASASTGEVSAPWPFTVTASEPLVLSIQSTDPNVAVSGPDAGGNFTITINS